MSEKKVVKKDGVEAVVFFKDGVELYDEVKVSSHIPALTKDQFDRIAEIVGEGPKKTKICGYCGSTFVSEDE